MTKQSLVYRIRNFDEHGYRKRSIWIAEMCAVPVERTLAGTVENAAGYGSQEACDSVQRDMLALRRVGHSHTYSGIYSSQRLELVFQHYKTDDDGIDQWCDPNFDFGRRLHDAATAIKLARRIGRRINKLRERPDISVSDYTFSDPEVVARALESLGAVRIVDIRLDGHWWVKHGEGPVEYAIAMGAE